MKQELNTDILFDKFQSGSEDQPHTTEEGGLNTNVLFEKIEENDPIDRNEIPFVSREETINDLYKKITASYRSINQFAEACGIYPSHFHDFLKGIKKLSRDKLIIVCITLKLNIKESRELLKRVIQADFYPKNKRDFEIMCCIRQGKSLSDTNEILSNMGLDPLD